MSFLSSIECCTKCNRGYDSIRVSPSGTLDSKWMVIGSIPSKLDEVYGIPFSSVGSPGKTFSSYLDILEIPRSGVYITNACFCRSKGSIPTNIELATCSFYKEQEFESMPNLSYVILVGNSAVRQSLGYDYPSLIFTSGRYFDIILYNKCVTVFMIHTPGYFLRRRKILRKSVFDSLLKFKEHIKDGC